MRRSLAILLPLVAMLLSTGCKLPGQHNLPPATQLMHPGPGVDGPGPGVLAPVSGPGPFSGPISQVAFLGPEGMQVLWDVGGPGLFDSEPLIAPGRYNFPQGAIYRLKLLDIPGRPGLELYPTLEIAPTLPRTDAFLSHNAIPVQFTEEDLDQVTSGNFVTKVIYLPDAEYQELAIAGVETLVSTRLDPGVDPIVEADRRGSILGVVRLGNKDLQLPGAIPGGGLGGEGVMPAGYCPPGGGPGGVASLPGAANTGPVWGMPMSGTPIGLPGPPHIPLGSPAGLRRHTIANHTHQHYPGPSPYQRIDVMQTPGMNYPKPASHAFIHESTVAPPGWFHQPLGDKTHLIPKGH